MNASMSQTLAPWSWIEPLPVVVPLSDDFDCRDAFVRLSRLPGCLWLDSAPHTSASRRLMTRRNRSPSTRGPRQTTAVGYTGWLQTHPAMIEEPIDLAVQGRYSFLTADPVATFRCQRTDANGWQNMSQWLNDQLKTIFPATVAVPLPPFQGGIAGLWGYEAAHWLERIGGAGEDDLPTAPIVLGLYDWVLAYDHQVRRGWLISQGIPETRQDRRLHRAVRRIDQVTAWLQAPVEVAVWHANAVSNVTPGKQYATRKSSRLTSNFSSSGFREAVAAIVAGIRRGDSFQVNLAQRLLLPQQLSSPELYLRLRQHNPAPMAGYFDAGDFQVLSSSPEGFLQVHDRHVETRPIKGTVPRTGDPEVDQRFAQQLAASPKDHAENVMIVDLMRNDLSRVCTDESVRVEQLCRLEQYAFVQHLVSVVRGTLRHDCTLADLLSACFPGGSVTGAPKVEAMRTINRLEPNPRGPYCGSVGYIGCGGAADFNILIRTVTAAHGWLQIPVGGGITAQSDPVAEERETWQKAEGMLQALLP